jgi:tetratricopeptide (TPR) repeat protein
VQVVVTWGLACAWLLLMGLGTLTYLGPDWLQGLAAPGRRTEASVCKSHGDDCLRQGNYRLAIAQYQQALKITPDNRAAKLNLALAWLQAGDSARGARILKNLLPTETSGSAKEFIYFNLGELAAREGRVQEAVEHYQRAADAGVEQARAYRRLGSLYLGTGQYEQARQAFEAAVANQTDLTVPYRSMLQKSLDGFQYDTGRILVLDKQLSRDDSLSAIQAQLSQEITVEQLARYDLDTVRQVQQHDPAIAETHSQLGLVYSHLGNLDEAIRHVRKSLEIVPDSAGARKNLQLLLEMQKAQPAPPDAP